MVQIARPIPAACLVRCDNLPELGGDLLRWVADIISTSSACAVMHDECATAMEQAP